MDILEKDFFKLVKNGDTDKVCELIAKNPSCVNLRDVEQCTPLHYAAWKGHLEVAKCLIDAGADINAHSVKGHWGTTPLHAAAHANETALAQLLIDNGADVNSKDLNHKTPLAHTRFHGAKAAAALLVKHGAVE